MGEYAKAEPLYQEAFRVRRKVLGGKSLHALSLNSLAVLYQDMGEYAKAEPLFQEALRIRQKVSGSEHPDTAPSLNNLAALHCGYGRIRQGRTALSGSASDPAEARRLLTSLHGAEPQ